MNTKEALEYAREVFSAYALLHENKGDAPDARTKAMRNRNHARVMDEALAALPPAQPKLELIRQWAKDRNLIHGSDPKSQTVKLGEEFGELCAAIARGKTVEVLDGAGDMVVVLTIICEQMGYKLETAIELAWDTIKDRKGRMVNGVFVKVGE